jgi:hypothetical protein
VERDINSVDRLSVVLDMARILHVDVESLIGRPWQLALNGRHLAGQPLAREQATGGWHCAPGGSERCPAQLAITGKRS